MSRRISHRSLKRIIQEELAKLNEEGLSGELEDVEKAAKEVPEKDASEQADSLEQNIDFMKALKIQEKKLIKSLKKIREVKSTLRNKILKGIDKE